MKMFEQSDNHRREIKKSWSRKPSHHSIIDRIAFLVFLLLPLPCFGTANLLGDAAFDDSTNPGGFPNSGFWNPDHIGQAGAVLDGVGSHSAPYSLHVYTGDPASNYVSRPYHDDLPSSPGRAYRASGYIETRQGLSWLEGSSAFIRVAFLDIGKSEITHYDSRHYVNANSSWELFEVTTPSTPPGTAFVRFIIYLQKPDGVIGQSIVNVDDCSLEEIAAPPILSVRPQLLPFGATNNSMTLVVSNSGGGTLEWSASTSGEPWITVAPPTSGTTPAGEIDLLKIEIDRSGLADSDYSATISVVPTTGEPQSIPIQMTVPPGVPEQPSLVFVANRQLIVQRRMPDDTLDVPIPYRMRGFSWSPASVETTSSFASRRQAFVDWHDLDLGMVRGANANTIYVFLDFDLEPAIYEPILDSIYKNGLLAIITIDEDGSYNQARAEAVVSAYKNHPAILMWAIGNEWNINLFHDRFLTLQEAAQAAESLAQLAKSWDPNHPVASIYGEINIPGQTPSTQDIVANICPSFDLWGLNIYRGQEFYSLFDEWAAITDKPLFLSEFGIDSYHTTQFYPNPIDGYLDEQEQANWNHSLWLDIADDLSASDPLNVGLGGTYFSFVDEWWKVIPAGQQDSGGFYTEWNPSAFPDSFANEEFFGSVRNENNIRIPKTTYYQIRADFAAMGDNITHILEVQKTGVGNGTVTSSPAGIDCGGKCARNFGEGIVVTLMPTPDVGSVFGGWSGDADCSDGTVTVNADITCTATFNSQLFTLTLTKAGTGSGTVISSPVGIDCGEDCAETYSQGTMVTLIPTAASGSTFTGWNGHSDCTDGIVTMNADRTCTATFAVSTGVIFGDGFESGDTSRWSNTVP